MDQFAPDRLRNPGCRDGQAALNSLEQMFTNQAGTVPPMLRS
jgi:hypothetical protein